MTMQVAKNTVVTLDYSVSDTDGNLLDAGENPIVYLQGGYDDIFPRIEESLQGKSVGESVTIKMQPDEAFGEYDADLIQMDSREGYPKELEVGMQFEGESQDEDEDIRIFRVTEITDDKVILDGNHPLAGMALVFTCTVMAIRPASEEEIQQGYAFDGDEDDEDA